MAKNTKQIVYIVVKTHWRGYINEIVGVYKKEKDAIARMEEIDKYDQADYMSFELE